MFGMQDALRWGAFRTQENTNKIEYIIEHSALDLATLFAAAKISHHNPYHNFGHQLGVAEQAIKLGHVAGVSPQDINALGFAGLTHDAGHTGKYHINDEINAWQLVDHNFDDETFSQLGFSREMNRDLILCTSFSQRGKWSWELAKILQDSDLASLGLGPDYRLYSAMGLVDEYGVNPHDFVAKQQKAFLEYLGKIDPDIFLSQAAKKSYIPARWSYDLILTWPKEVIDYAYQVRYQDISFEAFKKKSDQLKKGAR